jgi:hypothetical protein
MHAPAKPNKMQTLYREYTQHRFITLNQQQFTYVVNLFPLLLVILSDGSVDRDEWQVVKKLAEFLGSEFATDDLGLEKEENLALIYEGEFKYLLKNKDKWEKKFLEALKECFEQNNLIKDFVAETISIFASVAQETPSQKDAIIDMLSEKLELSLPFK